jgi:hypothetical protein
VKHFSPKHWFRKWLSFAPPSRRAKWFRPALEALEARLAPTASFVVNDSGDAPLGPNPHGDHTGQVHDSHGDPTGQTTLRSALQQINVEGGGSITFAVSGTIAVTSTALPQISVPVTIDGAGPITLTGGFSYGLWLTAGHSTVKGLAISGFQDGLVVGGTDNTIGGPGQGNVITGNSNIGLWLQGSSNVVQGNHIVGNHDGVYISGGTATNTIGGSGAEKGNIITNNTRIGLYLQGTGNLVQGNDITNNADGAYIGTGGHNNTIGGPGAGEGNVITGNTTYGLALQGPNTSGNMVQGNHITGNRTGAAIYGGAASNTIGGAGPDQGNVITGNTDNGLTLLDQGTSNNLVQGNDIEANEVDGVYVGGGASNNTIGGMSDTARNVISANGNDGITISGFTGVGTTGNRVQGNYIGTNADGTADLGNGDEGVSIGYAARNNTIGGADPAARNIISGNGDAGIDIFGGDPGNPTGNQVLGNYIGTDVTGRIPIANASGIAIYDGATDNTIGGITAASRNIIAGNTNDGVAIYDTDTTVTSRNFVQGNFIGTDVTGEVALSNGQGVSIYGGATNNIIGGTTTAARNLISGNAGPGVSIIGAGTTGNLVQGNLIATNKDGTGALANDGDGVSISAGASNNTVGGTDRNASNIISGNASDGVAISGSDTTGNLVQGNYIGTNDGGSAPLANIGDGVSVSDGANNNTIGGTSAAAGNIISGNGRDGVSISGQGVAGNQVQGNYIGTDATATIDLGNSRNGVFISSQASDNTIGGTDPGAGNTIAFNGNSGIVVGQSGTDLAVHNALRRNSIFANRGLGIDLGNDGTTPNHHGGPVPGPNHLQNFPVLPLSSHRGTLNSGPNTTFRLEFYENTQANPSPLGEGKNFLTAFNVQTDAQGNATFDVPIGRLVSATATDPDGNTSEFSRPDVRLEKVTTKDARTISADYDIIDPAISTLPLQFDIYRTASPTSHEESDLYATATIDVSRVDDLSVGHHEGVVLSLDDPSGNPINALRPDPANQFVVVDVRPFASGQVVVAVSPFGSGQTDNPDHEAYFQKHLLGVVTHGLYLEGTDTPAWVTQMADGLKAEGYEDAIAYNWMELSRDLQPGRAVDAAQLLYNQVYVTAKHLTDAHQGDVIDIHFIGHSRGAVVISTVLQFMVALEDPVFTGGYMKMTMLDPHPARNRDGMDFFSAADTLEGQSAVAIYRSAQAIFQDPDVIVPSNVMEAEVYWQHTPIESFLQGSPDYPLQLWGEGEFDGTIINNSGRSISWGNLTGVDDPVLPIGHLEIPNWYYSHVVLPGKTFDDFVNP